MEQCTYLDIKLERFTGTLPGPRQWVACGRVTLGRDSGAPLGIGGPCRIPVKRSSFMSKSVSTVPLCIICNVVIVRSRTR